MQVLPKSIDVIRLCKQGAVLQGALLLSAMPRLQELCDQGEQKVDVALTLDSELTGTLIIEGSVKGAICLCCQRCGKPMLEPLDVTFKLSPVNSYERAKKLSSAYEPLMISEAPLVLADMVEDEILLAVPMVPRHDEGQCQ